jgi:hypothetical protein
MAQNITNFFGRGAVVNISGAAPARAGCEVGVNARERARSPPPPREPAAAPRPETVQINEENNNNDAMQVDEQPGREVLAPTAPRQAEAVVQQREQRPAPAPTLGTNRLIRDNYSKDDYYYYYSLYIYLFLIFSEEERASAQDASRLRRRFRLARHGANPLAEEVLPRKGGS